MADTTTNVFLHNYDAIGFRDLSDFATFTVGPITFFYEDQVRRIYNALKDRFDPHPTQDEVEIVEVKIDSQVVERDLEKRLIRERHLAVLEMEL